MLCFPLNLFGESAQYLAEGAYCTTSRSIAWSVSVKKQMVRRRKDVVSMSMRDNMTTLSRCCFPPCLVLQATRQTITARQMCRNTSGRPHHQPREFWTDAVNGLPVIIYSQAALSTFPASRSASFRALYARSGLTSRHFAKEYRNGNRNLRTE